MYSMSSGVGMRTLKPMGAQREHVNSTQKGLSLVKSCVGHVILRGNTLQLYGKEQLHLNMFFWACDDNVLDGYC